jgi:septation ring formation regulator EzrA
MSIKDKIIFGVLVIIIAAGGYFQWISDDMKSRMDVLNQNDQEHLDVIDKEFREDLRNLNLRFEGRGKHIRKAQQDIISNTNLINTTASELNDKIDEVQYNLDEFSRITDIKFDKANNALNDLEDSFNSEKRKNRRKFSDIEQTITQFKNQTQELHKPKDDAEKKKKK